MAVLVVYGLRTLNKLSVYSPVYKVMIPLVCALCYVSTGCRYISYVKMEGEEQGGTEGKGVGRSRGNLYEDGKVKAGSIATIFRKGVIQMSSVYVCMHKHKTMGVGGMLPQEIFEKVV